MNKNDLVHHAKTLAEISLSLLLLINAQFREDFDRALERHEVP
jgi:hypothetical protein